jgi:NAD+ synthase (glutamine-hydrolysing)
MERIRIALAQMETVVGDLSGNVRRIVAWMERARALGANLVCFPELALTGYPPEDLLLMPHFIQRNLEALERLAREARDIYSVVGFVDRQDDIFNAAAVLGEGRVLATYRKQFLPTYGVFDEDRYFQAGRQALVLDLEGARVGLTICEDLWYPAGPARVEALQGGAQVVVNLSSSPYHMGKGRAREQMLATRAADNCVFLAYVNRVGGQDELVFDGQSLIMSPHGDVLARAEAFQEELLCLDLEVTPVLRARLADPRRRKEKIFEEGHGHALEVRQLPGLAQGAKAPVSAHLHEPLGLEEEVLRALVTGTRCYVRNNGFKAVVVGLSGGVDSALTAAIAARALGPEAVVGVLMPSQYTSPQSLEDGRAVGRNLGIRLLEIPIREIHQAYLESLAPHFGGLEPDVTEENLQARIRGNLLMALSNKFGWLVLTTGNKSETSTGYCTLYGDMAGGFGIIKDVPKTLVYRLARYMNEMAGQDLIPQSILDRPPTAELREGQLDTDTLPPYELLDPILQAYVEEEMGPEEIQRKGFDPQTVLRVIHMVDQSEYKRRQAPPGIKITARAFGKDRRLPITNRYRVG